MARNRRRVEGELTFSWVATRMLLFFLVVGFLLGITFLKRRNLKMGDEVAALDRELKLAMEETSSLETQLARIKTPRELENKLARWQLGMTRPDDAQVRRLREPDADTDGAGRARMLVQADPVRAASKNP